MTDERVVVAEDLRVELLPYQRGRVSMKVTSSPRLPHVDRIWFAVPGSYMPPSGPIGDPFFPALLHLAWANQRKLVMKEPVSRKLLDGGRAIMDRFEEWSQEKRFRVPPVDLEIPAIVRRRENGVSAAMFSGGIDAIYTILKNFEKYPRGHEKRIETLIFGIGFDIARDGSALIKQCQAYANRFAKEMGLRCVTTITNASQFASIPVKYWGLYASGTVLGGMIHSVAGQIHTGYLAATYWEGALFPWSTHPEIDYRWSSETTQVIHDSAEVPRSEKIIYLASLENPRNLLSSLRVCSSSRGNTLNCGKCEKCVRTTFSLICCNAIHKVPTLPQTVDLDAVKNWKLKAWYTLPFWKDNLELAKKVSAPKPMIEACQALIDNNREHERWFR